MVLWSQPEDFPFGLSVTKNTHQKTQNTRERLDEACTIKPKIADLKSAVRSPGRAEEQLRRARATRRRRAARRCAIRRGECPELMTERITFSPGKLLHGEKFEVPQSWKAKV